MVTPDPPLVAPREDSTTWSSGISLVQSAEALVAAIESGSWKDEALAGLGAGLDVAVAVLDPIGTLVASGVGWLAEHVQPLSDLLDRLTGDPDAVTAHARTWRNVAASVRTSADDLARTGAAGGDWTGAAADAMSRSASEHAEHLRGAAGAADALAAATDGAGTLVVLVRETVRDLISQLVATLVERVPQWTLEEVGTVGIATPHVVAAAGAVIARVTTRVVRLAEGLIRSLSRLGELVGRAGKIFDDLAARFARRADARPAPTTAQGATPSSAPDASPPPAPPPGGDGPGGPVVPPPGRIREALGGEPGPGRTEIHRDRHGMLTDGKYRVTTSGNQRHLPGVAPPGRSVFYPGVDADRLTLEVARLADEQNLWRGAPKDEIRRKAKVVLQEPVGVHGETGRPTTVVNVYRRKSGTVHVSPGSPLDH